MWKECGDGNYHASKLASHTNVSQSDFSISLHEDPAYGSKSTCTVIPLHPFKKQLHLQPLPALRLNSFSAQGMPLPLGDKHHVLSHSLLGQIFVEFIFHSF